MQEVCIITGGAGFIGCALSSDLLSRFSGVVVLDNLHPQVHRERLRPRNLADEVKFILGDVTDPSAWDALLNEFRPHTIIHLAAETGTGQSLTESRRHALVNVAGTSTMLDALVRNKALPKQIVLTSSRAVYGEGQWLNKDGQRVSPGARSAKQLAAGVWDFPDLAYIPFSVADTPTLPTNVYAVTKLAQEHLLAVWAGSFDVSLDIARLQNVYGPGQALHNPYTGIISTFARLAKAGKPIELFEDGEMQRDFVFIDDVVSALLAAIDNPGQGARRFDVGIGSRHTIHDAARILSARYQSPAPFISGSYRLGDVRHAGCTIEPTTALLGWRPQHSLQYGLNLLCEWMDNNDH